MKNLKWFSMIAVFAFMMIFSTNSSAATSIENSTSEPILEQVEVGEKPNPRIRKRKRQLRRKAINKRKRRQCRRTAR